jgi:ferredoxin
VGTLLGFISRFAVFKIQIPKQACMICARCSIACKAGCIRLKTKEIDFSRCIACFNCITVCEVHGIGYANPQPVKFYTSPPNSLLPNKPQSLGFDVTPNQQSIVEGASAKQHPVSNPARRTLLRGTLLLVIASVAPRDSAAAAKPRNRLPTVVPIQKAWPVAPPGAGSLACFNELCIACHLCVSACPYNVLQPAFLEYGWSGLLQARMDYASGYCGYECNRCGQVCPTAAIQPLALATKQMTQLGRAHFVRENCIVYTDHSACGVCGDYCPTKALELRPYQDGLMMPTVREHLCVGCGACENACPVRPHRAIYVEGYPVQQWAERPILEGHQGGVG